MGIEPGALSSEAPFLFLPCSVQPVELVVELGVGMEPRLLQTPRGGWRGRWNCGKVPSQVWRPGLEDGSLFKSPTPSADSLLGFLEKANRIRCRKLFLLTAGAHSSRAGPSCRPRMRMTHLRTEDAAWPLAWPSSTPQAPCPPTTSILSPALCPSPPPHPWDPAGSPHLWLLATAEQ